MTRKASSLFSIFHSLQDTHTTLQIHTISQREKVLVYWQSCTIL